MVHNKKHMPKEMGHYALAVYGHSHKYEERRVGDCLFLNPGSCGPRRFSQPVTMAVLEVEEETGNFRVIRKDIVQEAQVSTDKKSVPEVTFSVDKLRLILRDVDKGKSVSDIAVKYEISKEMTEQICRLYLTHPGIDAVGVREKMGMPRDR